MKASDKPEISKKWWIKEKPGDIKGKELESALAGCENALAEIKKKQDGETIQAALDALEELSNAVDKTVNKECDKKKHKDLITVLERYDKLIDDKKKELEKLQSAQEKDGDGEDEDSEEERGVLKPEYLARMIKQLRSGNELQFCFGLNRQTPTDSRLVLCNKRKPERLQKILKRTGDFSNRLMTFGTAMGDGKVLQFKLSDDAKEPSQILKLTKAYLKGHRDLKFKKLRVLAGGQTFEEDMPDNEEAPDTTSGAGDLQARIRKAEVAELAWQKARVSISDQIAQVQRELNAFQDPEANSVHAGLSTLVNKLPDPGFNALAKSGDANVFASNLEKTRQRMVELQRLVAKGGALHTVDGNPFFKTDIVGTVNNTLSSIAKDLQIA